MPRLDFRVQPWLQRGFKLFGSYNPLNLVKVRAGREPQ